MATIAEALGGKSLNIAECLDGYNPGGGIGITLVSFEDAGIPTVGDLSSNQIYVYDGSFTQIGVPVYLYDFSDEPTMYIGKIPDPMTGNDMYVTAQAFWYETAPGCDLVDDPEGTGLVLKSNATVLNVNMGNGAAAVVKPDTEFIRYSIPGPK